MPDYETIKPTLTTIALYVLGTALIGLFTWFAFQDISVRDNVIARLLPVLVGILVAFVGAAVFRRALKSDTLAPEQDSLIGRVRSLEKQLQVLSMQSPSVPLNEHDRVAFRELLVERVGEQLAAEVVQSEIAQILEAERAIAAKEPFSDFSSKASARIVQQIEGLGSRANINLYIGLLLAISGIGFLIAYLQTGIAGQEDLSQFVVHFVPRLSLVTIVELFSYFFLRLYKQAIDEIKYFQNEITNIEMKILAATITQSLSPQKPQTVISALASTERNFLVPKGQRIVAELPDARVQTATQGILDIVKDILAKEKS